MERGSGDAPHDHGTGPDHHHRSAAVTYRVRERADEVWRVHVPDTSP
ncbi:hypothetical protein [Alloactinosynnema sp. L-07]|nr:hypothetical protein [Alloactinosynnema sp. L-07]